MPTCSTGVNQAELQELNRNVQPLLGELSGSLRGGCCGFWFLCARLKGTLIFGGLVTVSFCKNVCNLFHVVV